MSRFWAIAKRSLANSVSTMLIYRANLAFFVLFETMFVVAQFLTIGIGYQLAGGPIAGWTADEAYLLTAVSNFTHQVFVCFFINALFMLPTTVWNGQFDYVLMKPVHPLLATWAYGETSISNVPNLVLNAGLVVFFIARGPGSYAGLDVLAFLVAIAFGIVVRVAFALVCVAPVFLSERLAGVEEAYWSVSSLGRYPIDIFPPWLGRFLTFVVPMAAVGALPAGTLHGRFDAGTLLAVLAATVVFGVVCYVVFMSAMRRYKSVNSGV